MPRVSMERQVCLEPELLDEKISEHLLRKIRQEILNQCDQVYGYITKIYDKIRVVDNTISAASSGVFFQVKFEAETLKPEIGSEYQGRVCMLFSHGIFVEIFDRMKVLVPTSEMNGYKFDEVNNTFKKKRSIISENDQVDIRINLIKYEKRIFNCIGSLI